MATTHLISIDQYLNTNYEPGADFIDGRIEERNVGEIDHAKVQLWIGHLLCIKQEQWGVVAMTEVRVQVAPTRFRIPDVCVVRGDAADERIVREAPLLCIEVLSPDDSLNAMRRRAQDYLDMGVPEVWIFDPSTRTAYVCSATSTTEHKEGVLRLERSAVGRSEVERDEVEISLADAFKPLKRK